MQRPSRGTTALVSAALLAACASVQETETDGQSIVGADDLGAPPPQEPWSDADRRFFYHASIGAKQLPLDWWKALEAPYEATPFLGPRHLEVLGLLPDARDPDGLPIGFAKIDVDRTYYTAFDPKGVYAGLTCAACHTGEINYRGQRLLVDGGSGRVDIQRFILQLRSTLNTTRREREKLDRFSSRVTTVAWTPSSDLDVYYQTLVRIAPRGTGVAEGYGRSDTVSKGIAAFAPYDRANEVAIAAPVKIPPLWGTHRYDYHHASGSIRQGLGRDVSVAFAAGSGVVLPNIPGIPGFLSTSTPEWSSSIQLENLHRIEELVARLPAPKWPEAMLGPIDRGLAAAGKPIYRRECASCHDGTPSADRSELALRSVPIQDVATDPEAALVVTTPIRTGALGWGTLPADQLFHRLTDKVTQKLFAERGVSAEQQQVYTKGRPNEWRSPMAYKAPRLDGIWANPPYLHNGTVPTLADLLAPAQERPQRLWNCRNSEYDPVRVGLDLKAAEGAPQGGRNEILDVKEWCVRIELYRDGNKNGGHLYGTGLSTPDKAALLEYLKTL